MHTPCLQVVDVPESMQEVLVSCLILYTVRLVVNRLAGALPLPPRAAALASAGAASAEAVPVAAAAGAAGAAAAAGAVDEAAARKVRSEEAEGEGIKYEGYAEAIAAAQVSCTPVRFWCSTWQAVQPHASHICLVGRDAFFVLHHIQVVAEAVLTIRCPLIYLPNRTGPAHQPRCVRRSGPQLPRRSCQQRQQGRLSHEDPHQVGY